MWFSDLREKRAEAILIVLGFLNVFSLSAFILKATKCGSLPNKGLILLNSWQILLHRVASC